MGIFKRRSTTYTLKKIRAEKRKLETILRVLEKRKKELSKHFPGMQIVLSSSDGKDVEALVRRALEEVERLIRVKEAEEQAERLGINATILDDAVVVRAEEYDHFKSEAEKILRAISALKEKRGEGGE